MREEGGGERDARLERSAPMRVYSENRSDIRFLNGSLDGFMAHYITDAMDA